MSLGRSLKLRTGYQIPAVGLGTWQAKPNLVKEAVTAALKAGYRHIDAASIYGNEQEVGEGIKASGVPREEIFITSKLWNSDHDPAAVEAAVDKSLKDLQIDYLDLYLIHWPAAFRHTGTTTQPLREDGYIDVVDTPIKDTWAAMEAVVAKGKIRSIGVSNFTRARIEELLKTAKIPPAVDQVEAHPYFQQKELLEWCKSQDIVLTAYSPTGNNVYGHPFAINDPVVTETAKKLGKSPYQVLVSWAIQRGTAVLPKSTTPERIVENFQDFILPDDAFEAIQSIDRNKRTNFPYRYGVDIFLELGPEKAMEGAHKWVAEQKKIKAAKATN